MTNKSTFDAYPLSRLEELRKKYDNVKTIHVVRHAEGTHNVNRAYRDVINLDARLTEKGLEQCARLAERTTAISVDLIVTSTMTRCIQTALASFPHAEVPVLGHESIRETVNYACDRRRPISEIQKDFGRVDFGHVREEQDEIWKDYQNKVGDTDQHRESAELWRVAERGRNFWRWLSGRPETNVVVCTHSAFLRCIMSWGQEGGVPMMMEQTLDQREEKNNVPLLHYHGDDLENYLRADYQNCEMRSFVVVF